VTIAADRSQPYDQRAVDILPSVQPPYLTTFSHSDKKIAANETPPPSRLDVFLSPQAAVRLAPERDGYAEKAQRGNRSHQRPRQFRNRIADQHGTPILA